MREDAYYVFVSKQESSQAGYMRLGSQFGFVADANERTIAHELGHGIFKLEHPFKKDDTKKGTFRTLMDYALETNFAHTDWKQINDPKLKIYWSQGQSEGEFADDEYLDFVEKDIVAQTNKYLENIIKQNVTECNEWKEVSGKIGAYDIDFVKIKSCNNEQETMFQLTNGMYVYRANRDVYKRYKTGEIPDTELDFERFYFYDTEAKKWVEFTPERRKFYNKMPDEMRQAIGELANFVAPVEDGFILVTGKDFNREERNRLVAAGFIIWEVSGGKVVKGVKIAGKIGATAVEGIVKTFGKKAVRETAEKTIKIAGKKIDNILEQKAIKATQEAIAKGEIDEELFEEFAEEIADIATKKRKKLSWEEVKILFKKGKDFENLVSSKIKNIPPFSTLFKDYTHLKQIHLKGSNNTIIADDLFVKQVRDERGRTFFRAVISDSKLNAGSPWTANQKSELIDVFKKDPNKKYIEFEVRSDDKYLPKDLQGNIKIRIHREDVYKIISEGDNIKIPPIKMF